MPAGGKVVLLARRPQMRNSLGAAQPESEQVRFLHSALVDREKR